MWSKNVVEFGHAKLGETKYETIKYFGTQNISNSNLLTSCGCTNPEYNQTTKELKIGLHMGNPGEKTASITVNYPDGQQEIIILKGTVV